MSFCIFRMLIAANIGIINGMFVSQSLELGSSDIIYMWLKNAIKCFIKNDLTQSNRSIKFFINTHFLFIMGYFPSCQNLRPPMNKQMLLMDFPLTFHSLFHIIFWCFWYFLDNFLFLWNVVDTKKVINLPYIIVLPMKNWKTAGLKFLWITNAKMHLQFFNDLLIFIVWWKFNILLQNQK